MFCSRWIYPMLAWMLLATCASAQVGDWNLVKSLSPGARISVKTRVRLTCNFQAASDDTLLCQQTRHARIPLPPQVIEFERKKVREVRLERSEAANALTGAGLGA